MKKYLFLLAFIVCGGAAYAQCLVNSLVINTGYNPLTNSAVTPGTNGGAAVIDPRWKVVSETPSIATAIFSTGLVEVVPGANADVITTLGGWIPDPFGTPGGWLSCINSNTYTTDGTGPTGTVYAMKFTRSFRMCTDDSIKLDLYIANDNYMPETDMDLVPLGFSQSSAALATNFTTFSHFTQTIFLTAGTHTFGATVNNYNDTRVEDNPTGMEIYGTFSSATGSNSLVSESFATCDAFSCSTTCNGLDLPDTLRNCAGANIVLPATVVGTDSVLSYTWTPPTGLSSTTVLNPTLTVGATSGYYYLTLRSLIPYNWVVNGDFSAGNYGFTSSYTYSPPHTSVLVEGDYSVDSDAYDVHTGFTSFSDHTTGTTTGHMMIVNGGPVASDIWCETIPVSPNTDYDFSAWIANCSSVTTGVDVPIMQFKINGVLIGVPTTISAAVGTWVNFFSTWNSGVNTTATICIYDANTTSAGNDFVLDDVSFEEICVTKDSVYIAVTIPDTTSASTDTTLCISSAPITLRAPSGYASYYWNTGATTSTISVGASGTYRAYSTANCATLVDTFKVHFIPLPVFSLGNDTSFCITDSTILQAVQPFGTIYPWVYRWSTGSVADSIHVSTSGTYTLQVSNGCVYTDSIHITVSPFPIVDLGPDTANCLAAPITLQSSVSYTAPSYLWSDGTSGPATTVAVTGTYWLQVTVGGCPGADTINVTIQYDTFTLKNVDTALCLGSAVQVRMTANPAATFQWLPTAGIAVSTIPTPLIKPDTSAEYTVTINLTGCPPKKDSFFIDVQPYPLVYIGGNRQVCKFDTLHLHASVSPAWYTHYSWLWTPGVSLDNSTLPDVVFTAGDSTQIFLYVTTPAGCKGKDSANLLVHSGDFETLVPVGPVCPGDSVQLVPAGGAVSYRWHPVMYLSDSTSPAPWVRAVTTQHYTLVAYNEFACPDTLYATITVKPAAEINLTDSVTIYPGESYQIKLGSNCDSFYWFPPSGLDNPYSPNPLATPAVSTKYMVYAATESGCHTKDSISIYLSDETLIAVPNAFTPGSGVNNVLYVIKRGLATLNYFRIYNRWGNMVFETANIDAGWDGTYKGTAQPYDVYVYELEAVTNAGVVFHKQGNVTLIR